MCYYGIYYRGMGYGYGGLGCGSGCSYGSYGYGCCHPLYCRRYCFYGFY
ncbi:keratin-associated protein 20-2-like [Mastomys coucha]|nr:keratin-associated protein 20-2-like [Mastomys coucha]